MTWTNPPIVATGDFITAGLWNTYIRGNGLHLRGLLPDAGSSNQILLAASTTTAAWTSTLPDALLASAKVARAGDTMTGNLHVVADLFVQRSSPATTGYTLYGSGEHAVGYNGSTFTADGNTLWHAGNDGSGSGLDADTLDGTQLSALALVPSGLIAAFNTAGAIASGWSRFSALDGRFPVGAGNLFSVTWTESTNYGSSWSHSHATGASAHTHGGGALGVTGTTSTESNSATVQSGAGASTAASSHTHTSGSLDVSGSTDSGGGNATSSDQWVIPSYAIVWAQKG